MKGEESGKAFLEGFNCAQAVFLPFAAERGLGEGAAARIASSFGAGMGRMQETCGAVTGAFMALGLEYGFEKGDDHERKALILQRTKEFIDRFKGEFGTLSCKELTGCDFNTDEGMKFHKESGQRETVCLKCVRFAASTVEDMKAVRA